MTTILSTLERIKASRNRYRKMKIRQFTHSQIRMKERQIQYQSLIQNLLKNLIIMQEYLSQIWKIKQHIPLRKIANNNLQMSLWIPYSEIIINSRCLTNQFLTFQNKTEQILWWIPFHKWHVHKKIQNNQIEKLCNISIRWFL